MDNQLPECFAAATYVCYDFVSSDLVLELAWRNGCVDNAMPYLIQSMKEQNSIIESLASEIEDLKSTLGETREQIAASAPSQAFVEASAFPNTMLMAPGGFTPGFVGAPPAASFATPHSEGGVPQLILYSEVNRLAHRHNSVNSQEASKRP
jgi:clathrin heavy chain